MDPRAKDLTGQTFGWFTAIEPTGQSTRYGVIWKLRCRCGNEVERAASEIVRRANKSKTEYAYSCGCNTAPRREYTSKHGQAGELGGHRYSLIRTASVQRGYVFDVTIEYLWELFLAQDRKCMLSGLPLYVSNRHAQGGEERASLDRINSDVGYIPGNIQWVHPTINFMKHAMPQERFIELCKAVAKTQGI